MAERVLLTGAGGFVGRVLGERLARAGFAVRRLATTGSAGRFLQRRGHPAGRTGECGSRAGRSDLCVRSFFPDSQYLINNVLHIGMFLTPIFWVYEGTGGFRHAFYYWNPFTYFIKTVGVPVMSGELPLRSLFACGAIGLAGWTIAIVPLGRYRKKIVFVL